MQRVAAALGSPTAMVEWKSPLLPAPGEVQRKFYGNPMFCPDRLATATRLPTSVSHRAGSARVPASLLVLLKMQAMVLCHVPASTVLTAQHGAILQSLMPPVPVLRSRTAPPSALP